MKTGQPTLGGIAVMLTLAVGCLLGGGALFYQAAELALPAFLVAAFGVVLIGMTVRAVAQRLVAQRIVDPRPWLATREAEPRQELQVGLAFGLPESTRIQEVAAILREEDVTETSDGTSVQVRHQSRHLLSEETRGDARRGFRGTLRVPPGAQPSFSRRNGRSRRWSVTLEVELEGHPAAWSVRTPLQVIASERPDLDIMNVLAFEREVEAWLPEFVEEALRNPAPYDEEQRYAIQRVAARRGIS